MTAPFDRLPPKLAWLATAWNVTPDPGTARRRGPKPAHSVEEILTAATELADAGGLTDVSLPKIADRIGVTTNALYRYVGSKDELLMLLNDAACGAPPAFAGAGGDWRAIATAWVRAILDRYRRHPWMLDIPIQGAPVTPNALSWLEVLLAGLDARLDGREKLGCALLLDGYARSLGRLVRDLDASERPPLESAAGFLTAVMPERGLPILASMLSNDEYEDGYDEDDVSFGLTRILDGIEVLIRSKDG